MPAPYDTVETALNLARVRLNDAIKAIAGEVMTDAAAFTQPLTNGAWRRLQAFLADKRFSKLDTEIVFLNVPPIANVDPIKQVYIGWDGYWDGAALQAAPVLPQDFITPWEMWERPNGTVQDMTEMDLILGGLPSVAKATWNRQFDWRGDAIYMPGALVATDIRLRYGGFLADFATVGPTLWYNQPIPIMCAADALAFYICAEIARARGDLDAQTFESLGQQAAQLIINRDTAGPTQPDKPSELAKMAPQGA